MNETNKSNEIQRNSDYSDPEVDYHANRIEFNEGNSTDLNSLINDTGKNGHIEYIYGLAHFPKNNIQILEFPTKRSKIIEDNSINNKIYFDQIIINENAIFISFISLSGIRRYCIIKDKNNKIDVIIKKIPPREYMRNIFKEYKYHYIDHYDNSITKKNTKKSLKLFIDALHVNCQSESIWLCAQFVHWALNASGFHFQGKFSAKLYHLEGKLKELGFYLIKNDDQLKEGDIAVLIDYKLKDSIDYYGHICAWDGYYWISDSIEEFTIESLINDGVDVFIYRYDWK